MKFLSKLAAIAIIASTYASAWALNGTVNSVMQHEDGSLRISIINAADNALIRNQIVLANDTYKQEKLAILLTAKTSASSVTFEIVNSNEILRVRIN